MEPKTVSPFWLYALIFHNIFFAFVTSKISTQSLCVFFDIFVLYYKEFSSFLTTFLFIKFVTINSFALYFMSFKFHITPAFLYKYENAIMIICHKSYLFHYLIRVFCLKCSNLTKKLPLWLQKKHHEKWIIWQK